MKDLQISLLAIGACIVAAVYAFNVWQERQFRRRSEQAFASEPADDVLLQGAAEDDRLEPTLQPAAPPAAGSAPGVAIAVPAPVRVDPLIDYVVEVNLRSPSAGADLHEELLGLAAGWGKPVLVEGYDPKSGAWREAGLASAAQYARLRFALQMSNRAGCIEPVQLSAFRDAVLRWTQRNGGEAKSLDVGEAQAMAGQLDRFCSKVDIAIGINVITADGTPFSGTKIRALAEAAGLKLEPDGVFYARDEHGATLFTIDNHEPMPFVPEQMKTLTTRGITFLLDVPRVRDVLPAFDAMLGMATNFSTALGGTLVDDTRTALADSAISGIRRQLEGILAKMEAGQIAAGGPRALRLFS